MNDEFGERTPLKLLISLMPGLLQFLPSASAVPATHTLAVEPRILTPKVKGWSFPL